MALKKATEKSLKPRLQAVKGNQSLITSEKSLQNKGLLTYYVNTEKGTGLSKIFMHDYGEGNGVWSYDLSKNKFFLEVK